MQRRNDYGWLTLTVTLAMQTLHLRLEECWRKGRSRKILRTRTPWCLLLDSIPYALTERGTCEITVLWLPKQDQQCENTSWYANMERGNSISSQPWRKTMVLNDCWEKENQFPQGISSHIVCPVSNSYPCTHMHACIKSKLNTPGRLCIRVTRIYKRVCVHVCVQ